MQIAQIIDQTEVEGPGIRTAIWLQGCSLNCPGCCNQSYLPKQGGIFWNEEDLALHCSKINVQGITILGGEPLEQPKSLFQFIKNIKNISNHSIMLFTGYTWKYIEKHKDLKKIISQCDLVIAGPFIQKLSPSNKQWIGSKNQTIHFISDCYVSLEKEWKPHQNEIEFHIKDGEIIVNGTPFDTGII